MGAAPIDSPGEDFLSVVMPQDVAG